MAALLPFLLPQADPDQIYSILAYTLTALAALRYLYQSSKELEPLCTKTSMPLVRLQPSQEILKVDHAMDSLHS